MIILAVLKSAKSSANSVSIDKTFPEMIHKDSPGYCLIAGFFGILFGVSEGLKDVRVSVPQVIRRGETAVFMCDFDLEGDSLYSVKWYKGRSEFFRFTPKDEFPIKTFPVEGLNIDRSKSNMTRLTVEKVEPLSSGKYSCEVSAESSFHTALVSAVMDVVDVPEMDPVLEGVKRKYRIGDMLDVNCTSGKSNPPANLTWFVNDQLASPNQVLQFQRDLPLNDSLMSTKSNIQFIVTTHDFYGGHLRLRCLATIHNIYHRSNEIIIDEDNPFAMDSTQIVVVSANFQDAAHESSQKKRYYTGNNSASTTTRSSRLLLAILILQGSDFFR